jgi:hypothetical protein
MAAGDLLTKFKKLISLCLVQMAAETAVSVDELDQATIGARNSRDLLGYAEERGFLVIDASEYDEQLAADDMCTFGQFCPNRRHSRLIGICKRWKPEHWADYLVLDYPYFLQTDARPLSVN